eukprot:Nk52_evm63s221 gene=Nk52_evmTU63s221
MEQQVMEGQAIPVLDYNDWVSKDTPGGEDRSSLFAQKLYNSCCRDGIGFFLLKNHGIQDLNKVLEHSSRFFYSSVENKNAFEINKFRVNNQGYSCLGAEKLDHSVKKEYPKDFKEAFNLGKVWSTRMEELPPELREEKAYKEISFFQKQCHSVCLQLLDAFGKALQMEDSTYFSRCHSYEKESGDILRLLHYPPFRREQLTAYGVDPNTGKDSKGNDFIIRAGAHSDYGSITLLFQDNVGGLQLLNTEDKWVDITPVEDCLVVNTGDALDFWTDGLLPSTKHRVVLKSQDVLEGKGRNNDRYSVAYFCHAQDDSRLNPVPSPLVKMNTCTSQQENRMTAKEHLFMRLQSTYSHLENTAPKAFTNT